MGKLLPTILDTKYENILAQENAVAKAVARSVIGQNPVTAWDVLIPIVFVFNVLKFKRAREIFTLNFLFTKKLALQGAFDMIKTGQSREDALAQIRNRTSEILASDKKGIYSIKIRQKQMREVELLLDHYYRLLNADGKDYRSMVRTCLPDSEGFCCLREAARGDRKGSQSRCQSDRQDAVGPRHHNKDGRGNSSVQGSRGGKHFPIHERMRRWKKSRFRQKYVQARKDGSLGELWGRTFYRQTRAIPWH